MLTDTANCVKEDAGGDFGKFELSSELNRMLADRPALLARMGVAECLGAPPSLTRCPAASRTGGGHRGLVVRNIVVSHRPVYAIGEWAAP